MKITPLTYPGSSDSENARLRTDLFSYWEKDKDLVQSDDFKRVYEMNFNKYLFTNSIINQAHKTKMDEKSVIRMIQSFNNGDAAVFLLPGAYYKWIANKNGFLFFKIYLDPWPYSKKDSTYHYTGWSCTREELYPLNNDVIELFQLISFYKFAQLEYKVIKDKKKIGTRKKGFYNATGNDLTIVNTNWNTTIIRTEGFGVSGHFRLQPCGPGRQDLKIIWINPFMKKGYIKQAKMIDHET